MLRWNTAGQFGVVKTKIPGEVFCETVPQIAQIADKITVVRSMTHGEAAHERGTHNMFTGYRPSPALIFPSLGSIVSHELGPRENLPPYVCIPNEPNPYAGTGYLSSSFGPFSLGADPASGGFQVRDLSLPPGVEEARFARRRTALEAVNDHFAKVEKTDSVGAMGSFYQRAYSLISAPKARRGVPNRRRTGRRCAMNMGATKPANECSMARRLIAAGVRVVALTYGGWDFHVDIAGATRREIPALDKALAALIRDLDRSGLLKDTIVMVSSEFGRTPKINNTAGRDHWPRVFSVVMAGGGFKQGFIFGGSDATAAEPDSEPIEPADLFATVYHLLGIDFHKRLLAPGNRPIDIVRGGKIRCNLLA